LGRGASVYLFAAPPDVPILRDVRAAARLYDTHAEVIAEGRLRTGRLRFLEGLFAPAPPPVAWRRLLPADTAAAFSFEDRQLSRYIEIIGSAKSGEAIRTQYGGVLWELRRARGIERIVIAVTGYRAGLPELVMGIWGDPASVRQVFADVRTHLRAERQADILRGAAAVAGGGLPVLDPEPSIDASYVRAHRDVAITFLLPPVTTNDLKYREAFANLDAALAMTDRYRLATAEAHGASWVATDLDALTRIIDGFEPSRSFETSRAGGAAELIRHTSDKFQMMIDMDQITRLGMLSPESGIYSTAQQYLLEFRDHPLITARGWPVSSDTIRAQIRIVRREQAR
jgi:hypothetical protein